MRTVTLPGGRPTTCLGFGCGPLLGGPYARGSRAVIDLAYEAGFRHFDVAPSTGWGSPRTSSARHCNAAAAR
jgi:D-threo-aldose 1-dehydrogenase